MTTYAAGPLDQDEPRVLGPYRLLGRLGRGGMGTVYLGAEPDGRRVAVKVVNRELAGEPAFLARFRREVTAARRVRRFCTAPVLDAELDQDPPYIVTEYIDGPSLEKAVRERGPLPGSDLEGLAVGVATALAAIHGAGIVHRDLKPANVLLSSSSPTPGRAARCSRARRSRRRSGSSGRRNRCWTASTPPSVTSSPPR
ncbi:protein kinase domain-containing protein [Spirillospora albida]|uniref:protein kinase domain-containing protein n=1 Tax=Spirillospora albida TaxID=58123 RepID=UPI0004C0D99F|nr:protein kinase [Spirillospora albida]